MNLQELFEKTIAGEPEARIRNTKTAVRSLAKALGYDSPAACPQEVYNQSLSQVYHLLERQLQGKGPHTIRNAKNNLSRLFRSAIEKELLSPVPSRPTKRFTNEDFHKKQPRRGSAVTRPDGISLPLRDWTPKLHQEWEDFYHWCTAPLVEGRSAAYRKRPTTMKTYQTQFAHFFGYLLRQKHIPREALSFDHLFTFPLVRDYVDWQVNTKHHRVTGSLLNFLKSLKAMSHTYRHEEEFRTALLQLTRSLPVPPPVYDKEDIWLPLATIEQVGKALWPTQPPQNYWRSGSRTASQAGMSLMLQLWCCIPYRMRNMREMALGKNLAQNAQGKWMIRFEGEELKIAKKNGTRNVFTLPFPDHLVPFLEQYLTVWRPVLLKKWDTTTHIVFLNVRGKGHQEHGLQDCVRKTMYRYTGKALHPHLIRTIWATEYIKKTGDLYRAAIMLNDRLETVVEKYTHLSQHGVAEEVYRVMQNTADPVPLFPAQKPAA